MLSLEVYNMRILYEAEIDGKKLVTIYANISSMTPEDLPTDLCTGSLLVNTNPSKGSNEPFILIYDEGTNGWGAVQ